MFYSILAVLLFSLSAVENVEVEFVVVDVPKYYTPISEDIYISGSFNGWSPNQHKLTRLTHNQFKIHLNLGLGLHEYKFTRGSINTTETELDGSVLRTRKLKISSSDKQTISVLIHNWKDMVGNHTASGNIFYLPKMPYPQFNDTKAVWIYVPADYFYTNKTYPVIYMSDGNALFDKYYDWFEPPEEAHMDEIMEDYAKKGKETAIIVAIETRNPRRWEELTPYPNSEEEFKGGKGDLFLDFMIKNLKPFVDTHFRTKPDRDNTGFLGASLGGLMSFYAGLKHENVFSKMFVFSGAFYFNRTIYQLANETPLRYNNTKFYFLVGGKEVYEDINFDMVSDMMKIVDIMINKGYKKNIKYLVPEDGTHEISFWSHEFPAAFDWLFSSS